MLRWTPMLVIVAFAGCLDSVDDIDAETYSLHASDIPTLLFEAGDITFDLTVDGDLPADSDHIGAHYWEDSQSDPTAAIGVSTPCEHRPGVKAILGTHEVTCTFDEPGTYYLRGHLRFTGDETYDYWASEVRVDVVDLQVAAHGSRTVAAGEDTNFTVQISGRGGTDSDHIGAHYWDYSPNDPTAAFSDQAGACVHTSGAVPGGYTITCNWADPGTYYVFGHLRLMDGDEQHDLWAPAVEVTVT